MEELERICFNCNSFFPASIGEATEFGICLNDEVFEPFLDDILDNYNFEGCLDLIERKKFEGTQDACEAFELVEIIEIDDDSPIGKEFLKIAATGKVDIDALNEAVIKERVQNTDREKMLLDNYVKKLQHHDPEEKRSALSTLFFLASSGNKDASRELLTFFTALAPPQNLEEVHFKIKMLNDLSGFDIRYQLIPYLIDELYKMPSNNTTRQWISEIFKFFARTPRDKIREPLEKMLKDKRFSYRLKQKMKSLLVP